MTTENPVQKVSPRLEGKANICGAKKRQGPGICTQIAGWGTKHPGTGRCKLHGGASTGAKDKKRLSESLKGNQNALKHGERRAIWYDMLTEEEQKAYDEIVLDPIEQLDQEIRLLDIRERRLMAKIKELEETGGFTIVEQTINWTDERVPDDYNRGRYRYTRDLTKTTSVKERAVLGQIMEIEEVLTKVQNTKAKKLDLKHKIEQSQNLDDNQDSLKEYEEALNAVAGDVWGEEHGEE